MRRGGGASRSRGGGACRSRAEAGRDLPRRPSPASSSSVIAPCRSTLAAAPAGPSLKQSRGFCHLPHLDTTAQEGQRPSTSPFLVPSHNRHALICAPPTARPSTGLPRQSSSLEQNTVAHDQECCKVQMPRALLDLNLSPQEEEEEDAKIQEEKEDAQIHGDQHAQIQEEEHMQIQEVHKYKKKNMSSQTIESYLILTDSRHTLH